MTAHQIAIQYLIHQLKKGEQKPYLFYNQKLGMTHWTKHRHFIHDAYRGGRVEAWQTGQFEETNMIDNNSLYPHAAMNIQFPDLTTETLTHYPETNIIKKIGISKCAIINKTNQIGLLPIRTQNTRYFPTQNKLIIGTWTNQELQEATKNGYEIQKITKTLTYEQAPENPLKNYMQETYQKRQQAKNKLEEYFYKQMMNSCIGKLAQNTEIQEIEIDDIDTTQHHLQKGYNIIGDYGMNNVFQKNKTGKHKPKKYYTPIIPTLINAQARIIMHKAYQKIPTQDLLYTDTDSIIYTGQHTTKFNIGKEIGQYKLLAHKQPCTIWGKKTYQIGNTTKISGIPKKSVTQQMLNNGLIQYQQMTKISETNNINEVGTFKNATRNLLNQTKQLQEQQETLQQQLYYIDNNINDITEFLPIIKEFLKTQKTKPYK